MGKEKLLSWRLKCESQTKWRGVSSRASLFQRVFVSLEPSMGSWTNKNNWGASLQTPSPQKCERFPAEFSVKPQDHFYFSWYPWVIASVLDIWIFAAKACVVPSYPWKITIFNIISKSSYIIYEWLIYTISMLNSQRVTLSIFARKNATIQQTWVVTAETRSGWKDG